MKQKHLYIIYGQPATGKSMLTNFMHTTTSTLVHDDVFFNSWIDYINFLNNMVNAMAFGDYDCVIVITNTKYDFEQVRDIIKQRKLSIELLITTCHFEKI